MTAQVDCWSLLKQESRATADASGACRNEEVLLFQRRGSSQALQARERYNDEQISKIRFYMQYSRGGCVAIDNSLPDTLYSHTSDYDNPGTNSPQSLRSHPPYCRVPSSFF
jgi:hypothetical protein